MEVPVDMLQVQNIKERCRSGNTKMKGFSADWSNICKGDTPIPLPLNQIPENSFELIVNIS